MSPDNKILNISEIRAKHIGQPIELKGKVCTIKNNRPYFKVAVFECLCCGASNYVCQDDILFLRHPLVCENECCGKLGPFKLDSINSDMGDIQEIIISENGRTDVTVRRLKIFLLDDLVNTVSIGDELVFTGKLINVSKHPQIKYEYGFLASEIAGGLSEDSI